MKRCYDARRADCNEPILDHVLYALIQNRMGGHEQWYIGVFELRTCLDAVHVVTHMHEDPKIGEQES